MKNDPSVPAHKYGEELHFFEKSFGVESEVLGVGCWALGVGA